MPYAISLLFVGTVMVFSTCLLGELLPRYTLPMWELLVVALFLSLAALAELLSARFLRMN